MSLRIPDKILPGQPNAYTLFDIFYENSTHSGMLLFLEALGYSASADFGGVCFAISEMAQHAIFANDIINKNDIEKFHARLRKIEAIINDAIRETYQTSEALQSASFAEGLYELFKQKTEGDQAIPLDLLFKNIQKHFELLKLSDPQTYVDCLAMCDAIALYQDPVAKDEKGTSYYQDVLPFNKATQDSGRRAVSRIVMPEEIQPKIMDIGNISGNLSKKQFELYLADFKKTLGPYLNHPVSINFGALVYGDKNSDQGIDTHSVKITLNPGGTWSYFDINHKPALIVDGLDTANLAFLVAKSYNVANQQISTKSTIVAHADDAPQLRKQLEIMHTQLWKKVRLAGDWLEYAVQHGKKEFVEQILQDKQKVKKMESVPFVNALRFACENGETEIAKMLIKTGKVNSSGLNSVLEKICQDGHTEAIVMLIETCKCSKYAISSLFSNKLYQGHVENGLREACKHGNIKAANALIEKSGVISSHFLVSEFKKALHALHNQINKENGQPKKFLEYCTVRGLLNLGRLSPEVYVNEFLRDCRNGNAKNIQNWINFNFTINGSNSMHLPSLDHLKTGLELAKRHRHNETVTLLQKSIQEKEHKEEKETKGSVLPLYSSTRRGFSELKVNSTTQTTVSSTRNITQKSTTDSKQDSSESNSETFQKRSPRM